MLCYQHTHVRDVSRAYGVLNNWSVAEPFTPLQVQILLDYYGSCLPLNYGKVQSWSSESRETARALLLLSVKHAGLVSNVRAEQRVGTALCVLRAQIDKAAEKNHCKKDMECRDMGRVSTGGMAGPA